MLPVREVVVTSTVKESLRSTERGSLQVLTFNRNRNCRVQLTNFGSEGKPMLYLSVVHYQVLLCLDTLQMPNNKS